MFLHRGLYCALFPGVAALTMIGVTSLRPGKNPVALRSQEYVLPYAPSLVIRASALSSNGRLAPVKASCGSIESRCDEKPGWRLIISFSEG